jgi:peptidoglycan/xylan/chitin deacetylase (PgdA/CDA1 family)
MSAAADAFVHRLPPRFRFPGGRRIAVVFNIAYEAWSDGKAPGIGPMGNVLQPGYFDTNAHSWATFGPVRGIQRLIRIAEANGIKTSVMVSGVLAERYPETVRTIHAHGHEVLAHSWGMDVIPVYLDEAAERANIRRNVAALEGVTGVRPVGWISPRGTGSLASPRLLAEEGFLWHGDCNDDDLPYVIEAGGRRLVAIPLTMDVNDLPHSIRYGNPPRALLELFTDTLAAARRDEAPLMIDVTAHTHVYGRAFGAWVFGGAMRLAQRARDVWIGTRAEMARHVLAFVDGKASPPAKRRKR